MTNFAWFSSTAEFLKELENPEFISSLKGKFRASFKEDPSIELVNSWASEIVFLKKALEGVDGSIVLEYRIPGSGERADVVVISEGAERNAVILEMKGWRKGIEKSPFLYDTDQNPTNQVNPIYQMLNYVGSFDADMPEGKINKLNAICFRNQKMELISLADCIIC